MTAVKRYDIENLILNVHSLTFHLYSQRKPKKVCISKSGVDRLLNSSFPKIDRFSLPPIASRIGGGGCFDRMTVQSKRLELNKPSQFSPLNSPNDLLHDLRTGRLQMQINLTGFLQVNQTLLHIEISNRDQLSHHG